MLLLTSLFLVFLTPIRSPVHTAETPSGQIQHVLCLPACTSGLSGPPGSCQSSPGCTHYFPYMALFLLSAQNRLKKSGFQLTDLITHKFCYCIHCMSIHPLSTAYFVVTEYIFWQRLVHVAGFWAPTSLFTLVVLFITVIICLGFTCFGYFKYLSPHNYKVSICPMWICQTHLWHFWWLKEINVYIGLEVEEEGEEKSEDAAEENSEVDNVFTTELACLFINLRATGCPLVNCLFYFFVSSFEGRTGCNINQNNTHSTDFEKITFFYCRSTFPECLIQNLLPALQWAPNLNSLMVPQRKAWTTAYVHWSTRQKSAMELKTWKLDYLPWFILSPTPLLGRENNAWQGNGNNALFVPSESLFRQLVFIYSILIFFFFLSFYMYVGVWMLCVYISIGRIFGSTTVLKSEIHTVLWLKELYWVSTLKHSSHVMVSVFDLLYSGLTF